MIRRIWCTGEMLKMCMKNEMKGKVQVHGIYKTIYGIE